MARSTRNIPGHLMADEPYSLTTEQIEALNSMPPGLYLVCYSCRRFSPATHTLSLAFEGRAEVYCDRCQREKTAHA